MSTKTPITADADNPLTAGSLYPQPNGWLVLPDYLRGFKGIETWPSPISPGRTAYFVEVGSDAWEAFIRHDSIKYQSRPPETVPGVSMLPDLSLGASSTDGEAETAPTIPDHSVSVRPARIARAASSVLSSAVRDRWPPLDILLVLVVVCIALAFSHE